jgi:tetratricopeptide (TPR) repeat protein
MLPRAVRNKNRMILGRLTSDFRQRWTRHIARSALVALGATVSLSLGALAQETADEARAINKQILPLLQAGQLDEVATLAEKGLRLCGGAGSVKGYCAGAFHEILGDVALHRAQYPEALQHFQQSLTEREAQEGHEEALIARTHYWIGRARVGLKQPKEAETALKYAIAILEKRTPVDQQLGHALLELERLYVASDRPAEAVAAGRRAVDTYAATDGTNGKFTAAAKEMLGIALATLGCTQFRREEYDSAEVSLREGLPLMGGPPASWEDLFERSHIFLGDLYELKGHYSEAVQIELRALDYSEKVRGPRDPFLPPILARLSLHYFDVQELDKAIAYAQRAISVLDERKQETEALVAALKTLGRAQSKRGRYAEADNAFARAKDVIDRTVPAGDWRQADIRNEIGILRRQQGRYGEAEQEFRAAIALQERFAYRHSFFRSAFLDGLGGVFLDTARYREAEEVVSEALKIEEAATPVRMDTLTKPLTLLASIYRQEARYADAIGLLKRTLAMAVPETDRADALNALGVIYSTIGRPNDAEPLLAEALAIRRKVWPADHPLTLETLSNLAEVDLAMARFGDAEAKRRDVLRLIEAREPPQSTAVAVGAALLAKTLNLTGKLDEAETLSKRAVAIYEDLLGPDHPRTSGSVHTLAAIEAQRGHDREAEDLYRRALAIDERVFGPESSAVANDLVGLSPVLRRLGKYQEARTGLARASTILARQFGNDDPMVLGALTISANVAYEEGRFDEALELTARAQKILERTLGPDHPSLIDNLILAERLNIATGHFDIAAAQVDRAMAIAVKSLPPGHPFYVDIFEGKANLAIARGGFEAAEQDNLQALAITEKIFDLDHPARQRAGNRVVNALWASGKLAEAEQVRRDQLAELGRTRQENHPSIARALRNLATLLANSARTNDAVTLYKRALSIDEQAVGADSREAGADHLALASLMTLSGRFDEARQEIKRGRAIAEGETGRSLQIGALSQLVALAEIRGDHAEALVHGERLIEVAEEMFGTDNPVLTPHLALLGRLYLVTGRVEKTEEILDRVKRLVGEDPPEQSPGYFDILQLEAMLAAERYNVPQAEARLRRAIDFASKYGGPQAASVGVSKYNLAIADLKVRHFPEALTNFTAALAIWTRQIGDHAPMVGYALLGMAKAHAELGDKAKSQALGTAAFGILGPIIASQPEPKWL